MSRPTDAQLRALRNLYEGRLSTYGLKGRSEHGGHANVLHALRTRKWIEWKDAGEGYRDHVTDEGRSILRKYTSLT